MPSIKGKKNYPTTQLLELPTSPLKLTTNWFESDFVHFRLVAVLGDSKKSKNARVNQKWLSLQEVDLIKKLGSI